MIHNIEMNAIFRLIPSTFLMKNFQIRHMMENTKSVQIIIVTQTIYFLMAKNYRNIPITLVILPILSAKKFVQVIQGRIH